MSRCRVICYEDGEYVPLPAAAPEVYTRYDYGSEIVRFWDDLVALGEQFGVGSLERFSCPEDPYRRWEELEELVEDAEEEDDRTRAASLRTEMEGLLPAHPPSEILVTVRDLISRLEADPAALGDETEIASLELHAYELALEKARGESRRVFLTPY